MIEFNYGYLIPDPLRPGPDYYKNCKKFDWVEKLKKSHSNYIKLNNGEDVYAYKYTKEELAII